MKKTIKKLFTLFLVSIVVLSIFGCGAKKDDNKLIVALHTGFPPYEYKEGGEIVGIDPDMVKEIAKRIGKEVEFMDIAFDAIIPAIQSGKADIAATGMTVTEDRKKSVNFTDMYQDAAQSIIVKADSTIKSKDDLAGKLIAVQTGTISDLYCTDDGNEVQRYTSIIDGVQALVSDKVDACVTDDQVAKACVEEINKANPNSNLIVLPAPYVEEHYAMALNKNNTELLEKVNATLNDMINDGTLATIKGKYIKD